MNPQGSTGRERSGCGRTQGPVSSTGSAPVEVGSTLRFFNRVNR
jgi:hypothetical protein